MTGCVQVIPDHNSEKITKIDARLNPQYISALAIMECQSFQMYLT